MKQDSEKIQVKIGNGYMVYDLEFRYHSGNGRVLVRMMPGERNIMVETQDGSRRPVFAGYYSSMENAKAYARWMAMGL